MRMFSDLRSLAKALGGEVSSGAVSCPGPGHSKLDRSLRVYLDHQAPSGLRVHSMAGDDWRLCQSHVLGLLGLPAWGPGSQQTTSRQYTPRRDPPKVADVDPQNNHWFGLWNDARPIEGTIGEKYLSKRVGRVIEWPRAIRFHPRCPNGLERSPALVCLVRNILTNEKQAIHRTFLQTDGSDRIRNSSARKFLGPAAGGCIKLSPNGDVTYGLGICEGIEKSLSLMSIGWTPIWATCGTGQMTTFPVLSAIETLTIFADSDVPGQQAADTCATRWSESGVRVCVRTPKSGDWDEALAA
jgi:hypothetical protein